MAFHLGSLGFLTPFQFQNFQEQVTNVLEGHAALTLRSRLRCIIVRKSIKDHKSDSDRNDSSSAEYDCSGSNSISSSNCNTLPSTNILVLNEVNRKFCFIYFQNYYSHFAFYVYTHTYPLYFECTIIVFTINS